MNTLIVILSVVAAASAGHLGGVLVGHGNHGLVLQAPSASGALVGPDGSHISGSVKGGAVVIKGHHTGAVSSAIIPGHIAYTAPIHHVAPVAPVYHGYGHLVAGVPHAGDGHEGQYVPSGLERLYDDGSYKGEHHYAAHYNQYDNEGQYNPNHYIEGQYNPQHDNEGQYNPQHDIEGQYVHQEYDDGHYVHQYAGHGAYWH